MVAEKRGDGRAGRDTGGGGHSQGSARTARTRDGRELFYRELAGPVGGGGAGGDTAEPG
ncbi:hypothetical protein NX801_02415 [Streptomyces sp. LP05-1]|uniref:Uncharacterized protein n=1 Tax=Streptomyces pyxinae TaxID=2970734 RepID=A0ABT2CD27_9ACTN|nr:hypothetical protein [Streptomyces sp. LP05-1]MCS0634534.1 hypothetical protein [Streptomyces sp. LP05-1]